MNDPLLAEIEQQIERLKKHEAELRLQAGIFSRRNWGALNESGNVEVLPGLLDCLVVRLEQAATEIAAAQSLYTAGLVSGRQEMQGAVTQSAREIRRLERIAELERRALNNRPLCPDCRDKTHAGDECLRCRYQRAEERLSAPPATPTSDQEPSP